MPEFDEKRRFDDVRCTKMTEKALKVVIEDDVYWIPKSQIDDDSEVYDDGEHNEGTLIISEWIAEQKGL
jgi:hypothetical protein